MENWNQDHILLRMTGVGYSSGTCQAILVENTHGNAPPNLLSFPVQTRSFQCSNTLQLLSLLQV